MTRKNWLWLGATLFVAAIIGLFSSSSPTEDWCDALARTIGDIAALEEKDPRIVADALSLTLPNLIQAMAELDSRYTDKAIRIGGIVGALRNQLASGRTSSFLVKQFANELATSVPGKTLPDCRD